MIDKDLLIFFSVIAISGDVGPHGTAWVSEGKRPYHIERIKDLTLGSIFCKEDRKRKGKRTGKGQRVRQKIKNAVGILEEPLVLWRQKEEYQQRSGLEDVI